MLHSGTKQCHAYDQQIIALLHSHCGERDWRSQAGVNELAGGAGAKIDGRRSAGNVRPGRDVDEFDEVRAGVAAELVAAQIGHRDRTARDRDPHARQAGEVIAQRPQRRAGHEGRGTARVIMVTSTTKILTATLIILILIILVIYLL